MNEEQKSKTCFVICPIGAEGSAVRKRSDDVLNHIIAPAVTKCGYEKLVRGDEIDESGNITSQVIRRLIDDDLVVADLSGHNANVFYELAIRHAAKKPVVLIMERLDKHENIPFDVAQDRVIHFSMASESILDSVAECRQRIIEQIKFIEQEPDKIDSPVSSAMVTMLLQESSDTQDQHFGQLFEMLEEMRSTIKMQACMPSFALFAPLTDKVRKRIIELVDEDEELWDTIEEMINDANADAILSNP